MDGWFSEEDSNQPCSHSSSVSPRQSLFDLHRRSSPFCSVEETGCVPASAQKEGLDYMGVEKPQLMSSASTPRLQQQFHQINMQMGIKNMYNEEFLHQSQLGELLQPDQSRPLSSSSSLRSLSVGSPEFSSLILSRENSINTPPHMPEAHLRETSMEPVMTQPRPAQLVAPRHLATVRSYGQARSFQFPTGDVDAAMARAMLAVLSSSSSCSPQQNQGRCRGGAFTPYEPSPLLKMETSKASNGQEMMKRAFSMLKQVKEGACRSQETRPTSNQLHHMISERKRREKLNESFAALRTSLPSGTKRDKASVLASTIAYVNTLKGEISHLEEKNRLMEARLLRPDELTDEEEEASCERVRIRNIKSPASSSSSTMQQIELRVVSQMECDVIDLVLHVLECLKRMGGINLVSLDASVHSRHMNHPIRRAILTVQIKGGEWDEDSFKGAINRAVDEALPRPETAAA